MATTQTTTKEKTPTKMFNIQITVEEEFYELYLMLFEKMKQSNKNLSDKEINSMIFKDAIANALLV